MPSPLSRLTPFAGAGVGAGVYAGCGVGAGSIVGAQGTPPPSFPLPAASARAAAWTRRRVLTADFAELQPSLPPRSRSTKQPARAPSLVSRPRARPPPLVAVRFTWEHPARRSVFVAGSFNAWGIPVPLHDAGPGWLRVVKLPVGTHQYRFVVDGQWRVDESRRVVAVPKFGRVNEVVIADWAVK